MNIVGCLVVTERFNPLDKISILVPSEVAEELLGIMEDRQRPTKIDLERQRQKTGGRAFVFDYSLSRGDLETLIRILKLIYSAVQRRPSPWSAWRADMASRFYFQRLRRIYEPSDLDKAPYLQLLGRSWLAKMAPRSDFGPLQVIGNKMLEKPKALGLLDPYAVLGMNSWLVEHLKMREMKGFVVREIEVLKPKPQHQAIREPWSTVTMPLCCLPIFNSWGEPSGPELTSNKGCHYEGGPYQSAEMCFLRSEVEALGDFDIAVCQEHVGMGNNDRFPPLVVSQRFRKVLKELKVPGVAYAPVWLKDPGEPLWVNPWEEILGPYPEPVPVAPPSTTP